MIRVIKRYESRKLYDTEESRYVSLDDIAEWVQEGQEIQVIDNGTSDDVTAQILTQIILDAGKRGSSFPPTEMLHTVIREGERAFNTGVEQVQGKVQSLVQASIDRLTPIRRAREEMSHLRTRLADLERTLENLESVQGETKTAAKPAGRRAPAKKAATKKAPVKKAPAKTTPAKKATKADAATAESA